ncbi:MAG: GtrA family protein [Anaerolineaceae bacterium]|nr:GtrA family protein [Anaerolineaceae bacterium]
MIFSNTKERTRFFRFAIVGIIGAIVDFAIMNVLLLLHLSYVFSGTVSFIAAVLNNFIWNRHWTYPDSRSKPVSQQMIQFVVINVIGLAIRIPLLAWLEGILIRFAENILSGGVFTPQFIGHNLGLAIAILIVMFWNFIANRYWTYNDVSS